MGGKKKDGRDKGPFHNAVDDLKGRDEMVIPCAGPITAAQGMQKIIACKSSDDENHKVKNPGVVPVGAEGLDFPAYGKKEYRGQEQEMDDLVDRETPEHESNVFLQAVLDDVLEVVDR